MQRVRIGLTGLGFVFIAVLLAMALTRAPDAEAPITANSVAAAEPAPANVQAPQEPLAELGVAPGNPDSNTSANAAAAAAPR
jgi:hypothetical protein